MMFASWLLPSRTNVPLLVEQLQRVVIVCLPRLNTAHQDFALLGEIG
ncbi:hypothetical protein RRSWK_05236 [Rhodopirellula sp. SWK7]|nr:hypothetical protein RRSWK_05236 [Rhodopirellula sp. SWK7]